MAKKRQKVKVQYNAVFRTVNQTKKRYRAIKGSAGSGKSVNVAQDYILKLGDKRYKGANLLCVRKVGESNRYSTFSELKSAINRIYGTFASRYWYVNESNMVIRSQLTGNEIIFRGIHTDKDREKLKSINFTTGKLTWIWVEEATELYEQDIDILDDRLRGRLENKNLYYQITLTFNPVSSTHWIKKKYFDQADPDILTHHSTYLDNRFIDADYHRRMERRKRQDPDGYRIYGLGEWGEIGGVILHNYEVQDISQNLEDYDDISIGQDFGYNHANALLLLGWKDDNVFILKEIYVFEKTTSEIIDLAEGEIPKNYDMWCDSAEPDRIKEWEQAGYNARPVKKEKTTDKKYQATQIDWLKQRKVFIHPSCTNTLKEMQQWKWKKDERTGEFLDEPVSFQDDAMAALRYGVESWRKPNIWLY